MRRGHIPERLCRGCGFKGPRSEMIRFVMLDGRRVEDQRGCLPGRGIYCCNHTACLERLAKSKKFRSADWHSERVKEEGSD